MESNNQQNEPTYNVQKKKPSIDLYDDLSTTTQSPQALNTPTYNTILSTYNTSLSSSLPTNNTNCLSNSINTSSLPTNNTNSLSRKRERYTNLSSLFCPQRREQAINNLVQLQAKRVANRKFPPGIKFRPTDLELIQFYLYFKIKNNCVPWWNQITEVELYNHSPEFLAEQFPQYGNNVWYFFTSRERKYPNGSRPKRTTNSGYWKATGVDKEIRENGILKGLKKTLVFYKGEPQHGDKTKWIMHEYRLVDAPIPTKRSPNDMKLDDCVLCKIYSTNNRKSSEQDEDHPEVVSDINPTTQLPQVLNTEIISSGLSLQGREAIMNDLCKLEEEQLKEQNPPGFRFDPTDRELVKYYLKPRVLNKPLPELSFMEVDLYNQNPDTLADYGEKIWYFFTPRNRKYQNGSRPNRAAGDGYWKANGADVQIKEKGVIIGFKKTLSFMRGKPPKGEKTGWIMHEYKINAPTPTKRSENDMRLDDCVLCRIYNKKERIRNEDEDHSKDASSISLPEDDRRELMENFNAELSGYRNDNTSNPALQLDFYNNHPPPLLQTDDSIPKADELDLHGLLNDFDGGAEKEYHSFEHEEPPPGFRFSPTDFDLVMHYLIRKVLNHPLPWNRIVDVQLYDHSPEWLAEEYKQYGQKKWYFFTPRERKYRNGKHPSRAAGDGYWKATGTDTAIKFKELVVGYKKKLLDKWVLCMIYQKNESKSSKSHTQKAYPTSSHANDRNEPTKNVDMKIVEVLDFINHSYQNVPAFAHMHVSRFPNGFRAMTSKYGTLPHDNITSSFPNLFQTEASNYGTLPHDNITKEYKQYGQKKWYFFTPRELKYRNGKHRNRAAGDGYWKATGTDTAIKFKELVVGYKKKLVYYRGKAPKGDKTNWIMNEHRINHPPVTKTSETDMRLDKWVLCMIYQKNESKSSKSHTQKAYPTFSHANDRNEPMKNVDMKIVEVLDFINQSYQNVPAFAHMHVSRFPNGFRAMASKYGTLPHDNITSSFPNLFQTVASNYGTRNAHT
ncbi:nac transcription factor 32, partial [Quercus suber]